jgi:hypothetical protein
LFGSGKPSFVALACDGLIGEGLGEAFDQGAESANRTGSCAVCEQVDDG